MDEIFTFLLLILFVVAPLLERVLRGARGQPQQRPPQRRPLPGQRTGTVRSSPRTSLPSATTTAPAPREPARQSADATDLLPAELWEILTGRRPVPAPTSRPGRPAPVELEAEPEEVETLETAGADARVRDEEQAYLELRKKRERQPVVREPADHTPPIVVSLETEPPAPAARHAEFHRKLERPALLAPATVQRTGESTVRLGLDFRDRSAVQRAFVLQEVLGRPKGLADLDPND